MIEIIVTAVLLVTGVCVLIFSHRITAFSQKQNISMSYWITSWLRLNESSDIKEQVWDEYRKSWLFTISVWITRAMGIIIIGLAVLAAILITLNK
jgi:hypothetical protein